MRHPFSAWAARELKGKCHRFASPDATRRPAPGSSIPHCCILPEWHSRGWRQSSSHRGPPLAELEGYFSPYATRTFCSFLPCWLLVLPPPPNFLLFSFWSTVSNLSDSCLSPSSNPQTLTFPGVPLCISPTPSVTSCRGHRLFQPGHSPEGGRFGISPSPNLLLQCGAPGVQDRDFTSHLVPTSKSPSPASFAFSILLTPDPSCFPSPTTLALDPGTHA